jgi:hypothetical protein
MVKLRLRPLHEALRSAVSPANVHALAKAAAGIAQRTTEQRSGAHPLSSTKKELDPHLRALADKSQLFFDRLLEQIPEENSTPAPSAPIATTNATIAGTGVEAGAPSIPRSSQNGRDATPYAPAETTYSETFRTLLLAATQLQALAQSFSTDWPAQSRPLLPGNAPATRQERTWAPILAWIVLRSIPAHCAPNGDRVALFDRLLFRHALADLFSSMGMEGEASWQAAAQVRLLLSPLAVAPDAIHTEALWADPDVRWLVGVNLAAGVTYFNKQQFEELLTWLQLPTLLEIVRTEAAQAKSEQPAGIAAIEDAVAAARKAAQLAGYNLNKYLAASTSTTTINP